MPACKSSSSKPLRVYLGGLSICVYVCLLPGTGSCILNGQLRGSCRQGIEIHIGHCGGSCQSELAPWKLIQKESGWTGRGMMAWLSNSTAESQSASFHAFLTAFGALKKIQEKIFLFLQIIHACAIINMLIIWNTIYRMLKSLENNLKDVNNSI